MKTPLLQSILIISFIILSCHNEAKQNMANKASLVKESVKTDLKRYNVKSGIVKYKTKIQGKVMGSTIDGSGNEALYFKNWGAIELKKSDEKKTTHINIFGQKKTEVEETHTIDKLDNGKSYSVDLKNKIIYLRRDPAMEMLKTFNEGDVVDPGKKMLESIGGKQIGKEKVLGYDCEVWEIPGGKQWIYKGVPLKLQMTMMGITTTNMATEAKFNSNVPDKYFELPDYPIQEIEDFTNDKDYATEKKEMRKNAEMIKKMSFKDYKKMLEQKDPETYKNMTEEEMKMSYKLMQKMAQQMSQ